jgi:hypothetical protein
MTGLARVLPEWVTATRWDPHVGPGSAAVVLLALAGCWWLGGVVGVAVWAVVATTWLLFPPIVPVAVAQLGLVVLLSADPPVTTVLLAEVPVVLLLVADLVEQANARVAGGVMLGLSAVGVGGVLALADGSFVAVAAGVLGTGAVASYLLHRYLLVKLGIAENIGNR